MKILTIRQQEVLDLIIDYIADHGFPPTIYELSGLMGCRSPNAANDHLRALQRKGAITIHPGVSRGITITGQSVEDEAVSGSGLNSETRYFDKNNNPVDDPSRDECNGTLTACKLRFGEGNELPFGGFPGTSLIRS